MPDFKSVCVYCASSSAVDQNYKDIAFSLGTACAEQGLRIVYGGGHVGLMGILADAALAAGGDVTGVIPQALKDKEVAHKGLSALHVTAGMQERQAKMAELCDAFIVLPGGLGTLAEFFEVVTWKQLGWHDKPIVILNACGFYDDLFAMMARAYDGGFLREHPDTLFQVFNTYEDLAVRFLRG